MCLAEPGSRSPPALTAAPCGTGDDTATTGADRTVATTMVDIVFDPHNVGVTAGEPARFVFTHDGEVAHDAFVGDVEVT